VFGHSTSLLKISLRKDIAEEVEYAKLFRTARRTSNTDQLLISLRKDIAEEVEYAKLFRTARRTSNTDQF